jgi:hypothetical protein
MNLRPILAVSVVAFAAFACASQEGPAGPDGAWIGTVTTDGDVTTVVNEAGSVWVGTATLVEEASIGVETGEAPYLLGTVSALSAHDDRIFLLDGQVPVVRVYDFNGSWLHDIGRTGQGPGEFGEGVTGSPVGLATDPDGRVYVHNRDTIEVFSPDGEYLETWDAGRGRVMGDFRIAAPAIGEVLVATYLPADGFVLPWNRSVGLRSIREGSVAENLRPLPDLGYTTPRIEQSVRGGGTVAMVPAFVATLVWAVSAAGDVFIGRADRYEIERHSSAGDRLVISRRVDPVPVEDDERAWYERRLRLQVARQETEAVRGYDLDAGLPDTKPAFEGFIPTRDGGVWVVRAGAGERLPDCAEGADLSAMNDAPCWRETYTLDAFDADGRHLGEVQIPPVFYNKRFQKFSPTPFIRGDVVLAVVEDDDATIMVKRYRLAPPGDETR